MSINPKETKIEDEPGAQHRFIKGIKKELETPPKPYTPTKDRPKKGKSQ